MASKKQPRTKRIPATIINGVPFRHGQVEWEDAYGDRGVALPDFSALRAPVSCVGTKMTTIGLVAKIGKYLIVITERNEELGTFDYTLIPLRAKTKITYR